MTAQPSTHARRIVSLWFPRFALERLRRAEPQAAPEAEPFALAAAEGSRLSVSAANAAALAAGIRPGMGLADARAIVPGLLSRPAEPGRDAAALAKLARWLVRYGPAFNTDGPDGLWVDVTGVAHLYGGDAGLLTDLGRRLTGFGLTAGLGLAGGLGAAWALARFSPGLAPRAEDAKSLLAPLPVEALRIAPADAQLLRRLGLKQIGQLYDLPRASIERRFRSRLQAVLARLDQALGVRPEPLKPMRVPPKHTARAAFPEPLISSDGLESALAGLAGELCAGLAEAHRGARRIALTLHRCDGTRATLRAGFSRPNRSARHMTGLLREKLAAIDAGYGIDLMELSALATEPLRPTQDDMTGQGPQAGSTTGPRQEALAALIDRLASKLGATNVLTLTPVASHLPERTEGLESLLAGRIPLPSGPSPRRSGEGPEGNRPAQARTLRPILLLPTPEPVTVVAEVPEGPPELVRWRRRLARIVRAEGPERIAPEWWREIGGPASRSRDYYLAEDETGARFWLFRDGRHGPGQDPGAAPIWYIHGVFG